MSRIELRFQWKFYLEISINPLTFHCHGWVPPVPKRWLSKMNRCRNYRPRDLRVATRCVMLLYYIILYDIILYYIILYDIKSYYIILYDIKSYYITLYDIISYYIILYHMILNHIIWYYMILYCITLYCSRDAKKWVVTVVTHYHLVFVGDSNGLFSRLQSSSTPWNLINTMRVMVNTWCIYPLVNVYRATENHHFEWINQLFNYFYGHFQ